MEGDNIEVKTVKKEDMKLMRSLSRIRHTIIVTSGKGGVGKSTVSANIALALAMRGYEVGLMDADIHGPNIPKMFHIEDAVLYADEEGIVPIIVPPHLKVMSMAFLVRDSDNPIIWRGPMKIGALRQFISDVRWGDLDYLVVDLPPGTGDEPLTVAQLIPNADGMLVITTPQEVALLNSRKSVGFARQLKMPVLGIVENMSGMVCPHCGKEVDLFKKGGGEQAAKELDVPFLGSVPLDPKVVISGDEGMPVVLANGDSPAAKAFNGIVDRLIAAMEGKGGQG
ncbi:MAG: Mrp/NBP35 family ATP-binding protein [Methanomassiliicoccales archaeon]|nr:Mrp/NBP35 family ATP-binding protein [Methanomassiliicoccales archaeon]